MKDEKSRAAVHPSAFILHPYAPDPHPNPLPEYRERDRDAHSIALGIERLRPFFPRRKVARFVKMTSQNNAPPPRAGEGCSCRKGVFHVINVTTETTSAL